MIIMNWFPLPALHLLLVLVPIILCPSNSIASPNLKRSPKGLFHNSMDIGALAVDKSVLKQSRPKPNTLFQVIKPIGVPNTVPCKQLLLRHEFSSTDGKTQVVADYDGPPSRCGSHDYSKIVLDSRGTFKGTQDDVVFGVWLGGVELLRSSPGQGFNTSVAWAAQKDITRYSSLLLKQEKQKLVVFFRTVNYSGYTGVYHLAISISFYPLEKKSGAFGHTPVNIVNSGFKSSDSKADIILPISRNLDSKNGLWFQIENSTDMKLARFKIPQNAYRAVLEVYVSPHHYDQYWYSNYLPEFSNSNQFKDMFGNGPFRDTVITLDAVVVGAIWPYPVIYAAGYNMWNPVVSIRCFDIPSYDVELTPFLGTLLDGGIHNLSFGVANALNVWYIDANLHLWVDHKSSRTKGKLVSTYNQPLDLSSTLRMKGLLGKSWVQAQRILTSQGWVQSSYGNITTHVNQNMSYINYMDIEMGDHFYFTTKQLIHSNNSISFVKDSSVSHFYLSESLKNFNLMTNQEFVDMEGDGTFVEKRNIEIGYGDEMTYENSDSKSTTINILKDQQNGNSVILFKNYRWFASSEAMNQSYHYQNVGDDIKMCYFRNISTFNASIIYDKEDRKC